MIKTVLFDIGNVILPYDLNRIANQLAEYSPFSASEILSLFHYDTLAVEFETGRMSADEYFKVVSKSCQFKELSFEKFVEIYNNIFEEDQNIADLIKNLRPNYRMGVVSNTNPIHVPYLRENYDNSWNHFEKIWFSNEAGVRKPDPAIYHMALSHFKTEPNETLFIDDLKPNIQSAEKIGMIALHYQGIQKLKEDLIKLGVKH